MNLRETRAQKLADANAIVARGKGRNLTDRENETVQGLIAEIETIDVQLKAADKSQALVRDLSESGRALYANTDDGSGGSFSTKAGGALLPMAEAKEMYNLARTGSPATVELPGRKAFVGSSNTAPIGQMLVGGVYPSNGSLLDLFPHRPIDGPVVRVYRTTTPASVGAVTAEGTAKPDAALVVGSSDVTVSKIAAVQKMSEELLSDLPDFYNAIGLEVQQAIKVRENAWGAGILLASGISTSTPTAGVTVVDAVADAIANQEVLGVIATAVAMNPTDLAKARKSKAATAGSYIFDPTAAGPTTLFGLPVISTPSLAPNIVLVGDFANAGWVGVRDPLRVELGYDGTDWSTNQRTLRIEERLLLAITTPTRIMKVTLS